jgi:hypothetical protein
MSTSKTKVLYIAGYGRSGSTLLERLLGQQPDCIAVGELTHIWQRSFLENQLCSCGKRFDECPFWRGVIDVGFGGGAHLDAKHIQNLKESVDRYRFIPNMHFVDHFPDYRKRWQELSSIMVDLYSAIQSVSGAQCVVDSSKDPPYLFFLSTIEQIDLHVIHLIRDPRAVAHSWTRKKIRPEVIRTEEFMPRYSYSRSAREWVIYNIGTGLIQRRNVNYIRIRYEDMIRRPNETIALIREKTGCSQGFRHTINAKSVDDLAINHTVSGNPLRFDRGKIPLKEDDEWMRMMPSWGKALVTLVTLPLCVHHGYSVWPREQ